MAFLAKRPQLSAPTLFFSKIRERILFAISDAPPPSPPISMHALNNISPSASTTNPPAIIITSAKTNALTTNSTIQTIGGHGVAL
jgi:hypothetical protein